MQMTTQGIKASLSCGAASSSIAGGASYTTAHFILTSFSLPTNPGDCQIEMLESDGATWDEIDIANTAAGGVLRSPRTNEPAVGGSVALHTTHVRIRNTTGGALTVKFMYWTLI